jgi:hypothetical protein
VLERAMLDTREQVLSTLSCLSVRVHPIRIRGTKRHAVRKQVRSMEA